MRASRFIHSANIEKFTHTISGQKKTTGKENRSVANPCRIQALSDQATETIAGLDTVETYKGFWPGWVTIAENDIVLWNGMRLQVTGVRPSYKREDQVDHYETVLQLVRRSS